MRDTGAESIDVVSVSKNLVEVPRPVLFQPNLFHKARLYIKNKQIENYSKFIFKTSFDSLFFYQEKIDRRSFHFSTNICKKYNCTYKIILSMEPSRGIRHESHPLFNDSEFIPNDLKHVIC